MNKIAAVLTVLFTVTTSAYANIVQPVEFDTPVGAAQGSTPVATPPPPPPKTVIIPKDQDQKGNCPESNVNPPDNDVRSNAGSAPALES